MESSTQRRIQIVLLAALALAALRLVYVFYERSTGAGQSSSKPQAPPLDADYYVVPKKLHDYDLKSLRRDLVGRTVWVREGYRFSFYPYDRRAQRADFAHEAGTLGPIERLAITGVVLDRSPQAGQQQIMAVFDKDGRSHAFPVGAVRGNQYEIAADEILFIEDPHELYRHWTPDVWQAVARHEVKPGMNEIQAAFAVGMGVPEAQHDSSEKTVHYPNGGQPLTVTYRDGRAQQISRP